jgi:hypothetical protein
MGGGQLWLEWPAGVLQQSDSLTGPWTNSAAVSPCIVSAQAPRMFYRVKVR